ncbi:MAG: PH domain-containing protein [Coprobacillaceae bacterium]
MAKIKELELMENEIIEYDSVKGDYWHGGIGPLVQSQVRGTYVFTNKRILFYSTFRGQVFEIEYTNIDTIKTTNVGLFVPTGIIIITKDNQKYKLSLLKRKTWLTYFNERMSK